MWEVGASQLQSWLSRGWAGCNLHSAHLRERREEKKPLPPSRKLPFPCGSVSFHIKMDPLLLQHPTSLLLPPPTAAPSHSLILKVFRRLEIEGSGNEQEMMTGQSGAWADPMAVTISCQNIKSSVRALLWQNDSRGCTIPFSTQMETDTLNGWKSFFSLLAGSSFQRNCDNKRLKFGTVCSFDWNWLMFLALGVSRFWT